jgi:hypothetical protein
MQVEDLRREALQNQRELLQEKTKVKALSEGESSLTLSMCSSNCLNEHTRSSLHCMTAMHGSLLAPSTLSAITVALRMQLHTCFAHIVRTSVNEAMTFDTSK